MQFVSSTSFENLCGFRHYWGMNFKGIKVGASKERTAEKKKKKKKEEDGENIEDWDQAPDYVEPKFLDSGLGSRPGWVLDMDLIGTRVVIGSATLEA